MDDFLNSVADEIDAAAAANNSKIETSTNIGELLRQASRDESEGYQIDDEYNEPFEEQPNDLSLDDVKNILKKSARVVAMEDAIDGKYNLKDAVSAVSESLPTIVESVPQHDDQPEKQIKNPDIEDDFDDYDDHVQVAQPSPAVVSEDEESDIDTPEEEEDFEYEDHQDFIFSCYHHKYDVVEHHLDRGANRFYTDRHGWTALHWACAKGYDDIAHLLLRDFPESKKKRYIHLKEKTAGMTPLHVSRQILLFLSFCLDSSPVLAVILMSFGLLWITKSRQRSEII
jgi:ankyrin repeat protein